MELMPFKNGQTSVSEETFLAFQQNVQNAVDGEVLFVNWDGSNGDITLSKNVEGFEKIEIIAGKKEIGLQNIKIPQDLYSQKISITQAQYVSNGSIFQIAEKQMILQQNTLQIYGEPAIVNITSGGTIINTENNILVFMVIGYK